MKTTKVRYHKLTTQIDIQVKIEVQQVVDLIKMKSLSTFNFLTILTL